MDANLMQDIISSSPNVCKSNEDIISSSPNLKQDIKSAIVTTYLAQVFLVTQVCLSSCVYQVYVFCVYSFVISFCL